MITFLERVERLAAELTSHQVAVRQMVALEQIAARLIDPAASRFVTNDDRCTGRDPERVRVAEIIHNLDPTGFTIARRTLDALAEDFEVIVLIDPDLVDAVDKLIHFDPKSSVGGTPEATERGSDPFTPAPGGSAA